MLCHQKIPLLTNITRLSLSSPRDKKIFLQNPQNDSISSIISKMSCQFVILILATCFIMEGVLSASAASPDTNSLLMTPGDMERISKATQELEDVFKTIRRRKRSLSSFYVHFLRERSKQSTTPYYARM